jgi:benzylsuccinate CoA-transferase BbsF subunit
MTKQPLNGIRIIGFTRWIAGPQTTRILASYGAEVIKVESSVRPDSQRLLFPFKDDLPGWNRSSDFNQFNTGTLSLTLNLTDKRGIILAKRLVELSDIVVENLAGGVIEKLGLGYEELKKVKPDIIMLSSCMLGRTSNYPNHRGFGYQIASLAGLNSIVGWPDREPQLRGAYTDYIAPFLNVTAIMSALLYRQRTGSGQYIDMSQYEHGILFITPLILDYVLNHRVASRVGNRTEQSAPHNAYRCQGEDRWCAIAVETDDEWHSFCNVIGNPKWTEDPKFSTLSARKENEDELDKLVEASIINLTAETAMNRMQEAGVPAGLLENGEDILENDPQLRHRRLFRNLEHPDMGTYRAPRVPFLLSKTPDDLHRAPLLGEHNEYILKELLSISDDEIADLVIAGVIE